MRRLLAFATLVASCTSVEKGVVPSGPDDPTTLTLLVSSVNWWMWNLPSHAPVFLSLFHEHGSGIEGRLVRSWESSDDGRTWTYRMRTDVRWHDGVPVTAHDVVFTLDLLSHPDLLHLPPDAVRAEALDDSTLTLFFERGGSERRWKAFESEIPVYPKHLLSHLDPAEFFSWEFWNAPVGNGPFRFRRQVPRTVVVLEANPDYFLGRPGIDTVFMKLGGMARADLDGGVVDVADVFSVEPLDAFSLAENPRYEAFWTVGNWSYTILWNHKRAFFADARVRRALGLAIDRRELAGVLFYPPDAPLWDVPTTSEQRIRMDVIPPIPFDTGLAESLLQEAGWLDSDGDGVRERGASPLRFELLTRDAGLAILLQERWGRVGAAVEVVTAPGRDRARLESGEFDAALVPALDLQRMLVEADHVTPHPELRRIVAALDSVVDPLSRDQLYRKAWPLLQEEQPITILLPNLWVSVAQRGVKGLRSPDRAMATVHLDELWIEEDE